jgi:hypothetical protein
MGLITMARTRTSRTELPGQVTEDPEPDHQGHFHIAVIQAENPTRQKRRMSGKRMG